MKEIERVLIVGSGAVGTAIASMIHHHAPGTVSVLADGERFDRYSRLGFVVNGESYRFPVVAPTTASSSNSNFDLIIVAVKYHHLEEAIRQMKGHVGPDTIILSLLNGISSEEILGKTFGPGAGAPSRARIPPYAMILGIDAVRVGNETQFAATGKIFFGEAANDPENLSPRVQKLRNFFEKTKIAHEVPQNMLRSLWYKFMINVGINQASAILRCPYRVFQTIPEAKKAMEAPMGEVIALSQAMGIGLNQGDLETWENTLATLHPDNLTSMCQDVLARRKTEVEMFSGAVIALGRLHGVPTPVNEQYYNLIKTIESTY